MKTYYFKAGKHLFTALAAGAGETLEEGIQDAAKRMLVRWPWLAEEDSQIPKSMNEHSDVRGLLNILRSGNVEGHQLLGSRGAERLGSGHFMNLATELVAIDWRNHRTLRPKFIQFCETNAIDRERQLSGLFERHQFAVKDQIHGMSSGLRDPIDWTEVAEYLLAPDAVATHKLAHEGGIKTAPVCSGEEEIVPGVGTYTTPSHVVKMIVGVAQDMPGEPAMKVAPATDPNVRMPSVFAGTQTRVRARAMDQDVLDVLKQCQIQGCNVFLPAVVLQRDLYARVNDVLIAFGGKWRGGKLKAHVFDEDPSALLEVAVLTGEFIKPQDFGFFPTPSDLVEQVLQMAEIEPGMLVLEPQAGRGAFALPMLRAVGGDPGLVKTCELLQSNAKYLRAGGLTQVHVGDFLALAHEPIFDRVVMNPPFNGGVDVDHVLHAAKFLNPNGRLTAITSIGWNQTISKKATAFRDFVAGAEAARVDVPAGAFKQAGTNVPTQIIQLEAQNLPWFRDELVEAVAPAP